MNAGELDGNHWPFRNPLEPAPPPSQWVYSNLKTRDQWTNLKFRSNVTSGDSISHSLYYSKQTPEGIKHFIILKLKFYRYNL